MSTAQIWQTDFTGLAGTVELGRQVGRRLKGGEVMELVSDLGGGKTSLVKGLAKGLGCTEEVRSPSFTLHNQYPLANGLTLHHFDFYRLFEPGEMRTELAEVLQDDKAIVVVEWGRIIKDVLPEEHLRIEIRPTGVESRHFKFSFPERMKYLLPANT